MKTMASTSRQWALFGVLAVSVTACDGATTPSGSSERTASEPAKGPTRGKPGERPSIAERVVEKAVVWPAPSAIDVAARARLSPAELEKVDTAGVPVLVPARSLEATPEARAVAPFASAHVVAKPDWFTISIADAAFEAQRGIPRDPAAKGAGITVFVQGKRLAKRVAHVPPALGRHTVRGRPAWITQNEHVWSATWEENGATYGVEVECGAFDDARCADDAYLREVVESLAFIGGVGGRGEGAATPGGAR